MRLRAPTKSCARAVKTAPVLVHRTRGTGAAVGPSHPSRGTSQPTEAAILENELAEAFGCLDAISAPLPVTGLGPHRAAGQRLPSSPPSHGALTTALPRPLLTVAMSRSSACIGWLGLQGHHRLLFAALSSGLDSTLSAQEADLFGGAAVACQRCVEAALAVPATALPPFFSLSPPVRSQLAHLRLAATLARTPAGAAVSQADLDAFVAELSRVGGELPSYVLSSLLAMPSSPRYLAALVEWAVQIAAGGLDARLFTVMMHALLQNDNFFSPDSFAAMDAVVVDGVLARLGGGQAGAQAAAGGVAGSAPFDYISIRWAPLVNKWARVYGRQGQGLALYRCFERLLAGVPAAENKIPCSFYVRVIGGLIDVYSVSAQTAGDGGPEGEGEGAALVAWEHVTAVAARGVRLFGRREEDMRALWVVLLKAALTLAPADEDWRRLLGAYHLCAAHGHERPLNADRGAFLQVIRLVSAALERQSAGGSPADAVAMVESAVDLLCRFIREQESVSFLWLQDGVGAVLERLWEAHGPRARRAGQQLLATLQEVLVAREVVGVHLAANPSLARAMERFGAVGECDAPSFWWRCGCGADLPAAAKRCLVCLRRRPGISWLCPHCKAQHRSACAAQSCECGEANPRLAAAVKTGRSVCGSCGEVLGVAAALCPRCHHLQERAVAVVQCSQCGANNSANALYCSTCFALPAERRPALSLWQCTGCEELNYSTWSACRRCQTQRRVRCLRVPFVPWRCRCGSLNHPCRLFCAACTAATNPQQTPGTGCYTCSGCNGVVQTAGGADSEIVQSQLRLPSSITLSLHRCRECATVHPRDQLILFSPALPRRCMLCAGTVTGTGAVGLDGCFYHCGKHHLVNENMPFQCRHCKHSHEPQTGYHCAHCLQPRPEVDALAASDGDTYFLWRCLHEDEGPDGKVCGTWNYSWSPHCRGCGAGRRESPWECRARAYGWRCAACAHHNRPLDVLACGNCGRFGQPIRECDTCGVPHLTHACHTC